jgi:predicted metal-binding membrane protein
MIIYAWWVMYAMATQMGLNWYGIQVGSMNMDGMPLMNSLEYLIPMWAIMMIAMMGPTFVFTLGTYEDLIASANGSRLGCIGLIVGYLISWTGFAIILAMLQAKLMSYGWLDMMGKYVLLWPSAILLVLVGVYQFTWIKEVCHGICHSPMSYFLMHWRKGFMGGVHMGLKLGVYCVACCWGFMALGFVAGTMNLLWMGLATALMVLEKLPQVAHYVVRPLGVVLIGSGIVLGARAAHIF